MTNTAATSLSPRTSINSVHWFLLISATAVLIWSGIAPKERFTWLMEVLPAVVGGGILAVTYRLFRFSTVSYVLAWCFGLILMVGGHWTYAEVPVGDWVRDALGLSRNHYDRFGHFFQGVIPAMFARELLLRTSPLRPGKWLFFVCFSIALSVSAAYELFEWQYAMIFGGEQAESFLGSQGDVWDAQWDMFMAAMGAMLSLLMLSRWQDRQLCRSDAVAKTDTAR